jgi:hypothetical protein
LRIEGRLEELEKMVYEEEEAWLRRWDYVGSGCMVGKGGTI